MARADCDQACLVRPPPGVAAWPASSGARLRSGPGPELRAGQLGAVVAARGLDLSGADRLTSLPPTSTGLLR